MSTFPERFKLDISEEERLFGLIAGTMNLVVDRFRNDLNETVFLDI